MGWGLDSLFTTLHACLKPVLGILLNIQRHFRDMKASRDHHGRHFGIFSSYSYS